MREACCPTVPECCDMRGMLSFYILWLLSKRPMNGKELSEELGHRRGSRPSAGTIYPALKELRTKGLVVMERTGRATLYTLSEDGCEGLKSACRYFCKAYEEIFEEFRDNLSEID